MVAFSISIQMNKINNTMNRIISLRSYRCVINQLFWNQIENAPVTVLLSTEHTKLLLESF